MGVVGGRGLSRLRGDSQWGLVERRKAGGREEGWIMALAQARRVVTVLFIIAGSNISTKSILS